MALGEKFLEVGTGRSYMSPEFGGGDFRIPRFARFQKNSVCLACLMQIARDHEVQSRVAVAIRVQGFDEGQHRRPIRRLVQRGVKTPVPLAPMRHFRIEFEGRLILTQNFLGSCEIRVCEVWNGESQNVTFQNGARFEDFPNFFRRQRGNNGTTIRDDCDEAFSGEVAESFTNRNPACLKFVCNVVLTELLPFVQTASENLLAKTISDGRRERLTRDRRGAPRVSRRLWLWPMW